MVVLFFASYFMNRSIFTRESKSIVQQNDHTKLNRNRDYRMDSRCYSYYVVIFLI
jgi:hypothetical protein